jgi:hypothetical protein
MTNFERAIQCQCKKWLIFQLQKNRRAMTDLVESQELTDGQTTSVLLSPLLLLVLLLFRVRVEKWLLGPATMRPCQNIL